MRKRDVLRKNGMGDQVSSAVTEKNVLAQAKNDFVVKLYYSFHSQTTVYLVMEYVNGGDLLSLLSNIGCLSEPMARLYLAEITVAIGYLHDELGVCHRDLKVRTTFLATNCQA